MSPQPARAALRAAIDALTRAGVPSPRADAELLLADVLGVERTRVGLVSLVAEEDVARYQEHVRRRAQREPLQHIVGWVAMGGVTVAVGPGVFVPRPETELLLEWSLATLVLGGPAPVVLDLCSGSGALALAIAHARPDAVVHAVEIDEAALVWTRRNAAERAGRGDTPILIHQADVTDPGLLSSLDGGVDVIVANPPYVPVGAVLDAEVAEFDPERAVFSGADGLEVIGPLVGNAARWLRPGGAVGVEHDDSNGDGVVALLRSAGLVDVADHRDLAGRPRFATARKQ